MAVLAAYNAGCVDHRPSASSHVNSEQLQQNFGRISELSPRLEGRRKGKKSLLRNGEFHVRSESCCTSGELLKEGAMRTIDLIGCAFIGVSLFSIACNISDFAQLQAPPVPTAPNRTVVYRSVDDRFSVFMAAKCRDLDVMLASTRRDMVTKGIEACWNRFNPEL
jgi:hypothetical protein